MIYLKEPRLVLYIYEKKINFFFDFFRDFKSIVLWAQKELVAHIFRELRVFSILWHPLCAVLWNLIWVSVFGTLKGSQTTTIRIIESDYWFILGLSHFFKLKSLENGLPLIESTRPFSCDEVYCSFLIPAKNIGQRIAGFSSIYQKAYRPPPSGYKFSNHVHIQ